MKKTIKKIKVWITKYALTQGIYDAEVEICEESDPSGDMVHAGGAWGGSYYHGKGRDWHETKAGAVTKANEMRLKKISALKKQIAKLEAMRFE